MNQKSPQISPNDHQMLIQIFDFFCFSQHHVFQKIQVVPCSGHLHPSEHAFHLGKML